jgi:peptidoglycan/LPS O-acetylase OafA/YrhL
VTHVDHIRFKKMLPVDLKFRGLDSLRFVAALWVMMGHGAVPPLTAGHDPSQPIAWALNGFWSAAISGPAAVIVFFIISGFCIHLPYHRGREMVIGEFYVRRGVRIVLPMIGAIVLAQGLLGIDASTDPLAGIPAWSLVCEMIYYVIYPPLLRLRSKIGFGSQLGIAFVCSLALAATKPINNVNYPVWGYSLDWLIGLPCWLLGVLLASRINEMPRIVSKKKLWIYRLIAFLLGAITHNLALQRVVGQHLTLNFFAIFCFFWLRQELAYYREVKPPNFLEWAGKWSYSLYLTHGSAFCLLGMMPLPRLGSLPDWLIRVGSVLACAVIFYYLIERPSHRLAQRWGRHFGYRNGVQTGK